MSTTTHSTGGGAGRTGPVIPSEHEMQLARESSHRLSPYMEQDLRVRITAKGGPNFELPAAAVDLLVDLLTQMAAGNAVTLMPTRTELSTQHAADLLGVSRPFLVKILDERKIPYRMVGTHRRILLTDLMSYKDSMDAQRHEILDELTAQAQEAGMGY